MVLKQGKQHTKMSNKKWFKQAKWLPPQPGSLAFLSVAFSLSQGEDKPHLVSHCSLAASRGEEPVHQSQGRRKEQLFCDFVILSHFLCTELN